MVTSEHLKDDRSRVPAGYIVMLVVILTSSLLGEDLTLDQILDGTRRCQESIKSGRIQWSYTIDVKPRVITDSDAEDEVGTFLKYVEEEQKALGKELSKKNRKYYENQIREQLAERKRGIQSVVYFETVFKGDKHKTSLFSSPPDGKHLPFEEHSFDGSISKRLWRAYRSPDDVENPKNDVRYEEIDVRENVRALDQNWRGEIHTGLSPLLSNWDSFRSGWNYDVVMEDAEAKIVGKEVLEGYENYILLLKAPNRLDRKVWIDPNRNFMYRKIQAVASGNVCAETTLSGFRSVGEGLWYWTERVTKNYDYDDEGVRFIKTYSTSIIHEVKLNVEVSEEELDVRFPLGTAIWDYRFKPPLFYRQRYRAEYDEEELAELYMERLSKGYTSKTSKHAKEAYYRRTTWWYLRGKDSFRRKQYDKALEEFSKSFSAFENLKAISMATDKLFRKANEFVKEAKNIIEEMDKIHLQKGMVRRGNFYIPIEEIGDEEKKKTVK